MEQVCDKKWLHTFVCNLFIQKSNDYTDLHFKNGEYNVIKLIDDSDGK